MENVQQLLLSVWQEACRHIDISQSTTNIVSLLVEHIPVELVLVRRIDAIHPCWNLAVGLAGRAHALRRSNRLLGGRTPGAVGLVPKKKSGASPW